MIFHVLKFFASKTALIVRQAKQKTNNHGKARLNFKKPLKMSVIADSKGLRGG